MSYKKLPIDVKPGNVILCADGTISLTGSVRCRCENTTMLRERKNYNLPGLVVDLPTLTEKDKEDILGWGVPNDIDMIALPFVWKGSDLLTVRQVLGQHAKHIKLMSKVCILSLSMYNNFLFVVGWKLEIFVCFLYISHIVFFILPFF
jgi:pyruvate kinase